MGILERFPQGHGRTGGRLDFHFSYAFIIFIIYIYILFPLRTQPCEFVQVGPLSLPEL